MTAEEKEEWMVELSVIALKVGKVTKFFQPRFPGDGFRHPLQGMLAVSVPCPCGDRVCASREKGFPHTTLCICYRCGSWHTLEWDERKEGSFIFC